MFPSSRKTTNLKDNQVLTHLNMLKLTTTAPWIWTKCKTNLVLLGIKLCTKLCGELGSIVGIATCYGLEGLGIESRQGDIFRTYPDRLWGPPSLLYNGYRVFPGGKGGQGDMLTTHPLLLPRLRKSWTIPPLTLWVPLVLLQGSLYHLIITLTSYSSHKCLSLH